MKYHVTFRLRRHEDGIEDDKVPEGWCGATKVVIVNIRNFDGLRAVGLQSLDGTTGAQVSLNELFDTWADMGAALSDLEGLPDNKRKLAKLAFVANRIGAVIDEAVFVKPQESDPKATN